MRKNWRFEEKVTKSQALDTWVLPFNVHLGNYTDEHHDIVLNQLNLIFPATERECRLKVIFPVAFIRMTREALHITLKEAEEYLKLSTEVITQTKKRQLQQDLSINNNVSKKIPKITEEGFIRGNEDE